MKVIIPDCASCPLLTYPVGWQGGPKCIHPFERDDTNGDEHLGKRGFPEKCPLRREQITIAMPEKP